MVDVITQAPIVKPIDDVYSFAANPDNATQWYANIKTVEWKTTPPLQVGSLGAFTAHFLGRKLAYTYEFIELIPDKKLVMETAQGPFPMQTTYTWEVKEGNKTLMTLRNKGNTKGFSKLFTPLMSMMIRKANNNDLKKLKHIMESSQSF